MTTEIKSPEFLSPLTTVPQCTDNQFVSRRFFSKIAGKIALKDILEGLLAGRTDKLIDDYRETTQIEYKRSLLYSRQVVLNRAAFWNNPLLISSVLGNDRGGLVALLAENTIVPFLFDELTFEQEPKFDILSKGREAVESLINEPNLSNIVCVRLGGADEEESKQARGAFTTDFRGQLAHFLDADDVQQRLQEIAIILLGEGGRYPTPTDERVVALVAKLEVLGKWVRENRPARNPLYQNYVTIEGTPPSDGFYRTDHLTFELKLWMDLIYNSNLPRHLGVLTFAPFDFPTPLDVGLTWAFAQKEKARLAIEAGGVLDDIVDRAKTQATWRAWDTIQKEAGLSIPSPDALDHINIVEIRGWGEWNNMMQEMAKYLDAPLDEQNTKDFYKVYDEFLRKLSSWWLAKNESERKDWASGVAKVYRIGRWFIGLLVIANKFFPILPPSGVEMPPMPDDGDVKVVVENGLYLFDRARTDWRRTQLIRSIKREQNLSRDELARSWYSIRKLYAELPATYPGHDQSSKLATEE